MMNKKARKLKMKRTRYSSPVGDRLHPKYRTTVYDQALLGKYIMESKTTKWMRKVLLKKTYKFTSLRYHRTYFMKRGNMLLGTSYKSIGIKTGYNDAAKWCFCNAWRRNGRLYISVVTNCPTRSKRWASVKALTKFTTYAIKHKGKEISVSE
jgi:D-alanyl-D-alanine carboxypeptidase